MTKQKIIKVGTDCSGIEAPIKALEQLGILFKHVFSSEIDKYCIKSIKANYDSEIIFGDPEGGYPEGDITKRDINAVPDIDLYVAGFPCFVAGTSVLTLDGYKNIENIDMSDSLMTHTGSFQRILNLQRKSYTGTMFKIVAKYHPPIECTFEHPFYVREKSRLWNNTKRNYDYEFGEPEWKKACELNDTHYFGMKVNQRSIVPEFTFERPINQTATKKYDILLDDPNAWFMMGFFVGDGWIEETRKPDGRSMNKIRFAINSNDAERVLPRITSILPITDKQCPSGESCNKYGCCDFVWFNIFKEFGKYAHGKKIPEWVQDAPAELIQEFLSGYISSDGHITKSGTHTFTTVSENLALGVQRLYLKLGHLFSVKKDIRPKTTIIQGRTVNQRDTYRIRGCIEGCGRYSSFIEGGYVWYAPFKIETSSVENVPVYNFEVEHDNSYVVENIIVHNCQPFSAAGLKKGFDDKRGNVFWSCLDVIKTKKPSFFVLENVRALLWHDKPKDSPRGSYGKTWNTIWESLSELKKDGYDVQWKLMNTRDYGIPQNRQRIYIVGTKKGVFKWPEKTEYRRTLKDCVDYDTPGGKSTSEKLQAYIDRFPKCSFADVCQSKYGNSCNEEYSPCITASNSLWCIPMSRYACINELLALQGFESFNNVVSNAQMKKQLGNSMSVNVLEEIFKNLLI